MTRNTRLLIVIGVAVLVAALASVGLYFAVMAAPLHTIEEPTVDIVAAAKRLETGICLSKNDVTLIKWPAKLKPAGTFEKVDEVTGRGLITAGLENEPITENKLAQRDAGCGLPPTISVGMRAMSVKVNEVIGVAGFVTPGTRVDVLVTLQDNNDSMARVVVRNVQVLTAGTRYDEAEAKAQNKAIPSTVVTLMVTPNDAERIALASTEGQIMLALRNPLDKDDPATPGVHKTTLMGLAPLPPRVVPAAQQGPRRSPTPSPPPAPAPPAKAPSTYKNCVSGKCVDQELTWAAS